MRLADLQDAYRVYLLSGDAAPLAPAIVEDAFDAGERLAIYRNNFLISLTEALRANFPVTRQLLGEDFFVEAARRFVAAYPPRQPCLFEYGAELPGYLRALPQLAALNVMRLATPQSAILSAVIFNALVIPALIPLAIKGVRYRAVGADALLGRNLLIYGLGGLIAPFVGIKVIDLLLVVLGLG